MRWAGAPLGADATYAVQLLVVAAAAAAVKLKVSADALAIRRGSLSLGAAAVV